MWQTPRNLLSRVSTARTVFSKSGVLPIVSLFDTRHHFSGQRNDTSADAGIGPLKGLGESALWSGTSLQAFPTRDFVAVSTGTDHKNQGRLSGYVSHALQGPAEENVGLRRIVFSQPEWFYGTAF